MRALHDFLTKHVLEEAFDLLSDVELEKTISPTDEQRADLYFEPRPNRPPYSVVQYVGSIWRMSERRGLAEIFSSSPSLAEVRNCVRKQLNLHHGLAVRQPSVLVPDLWLLCAGRPDSVLSRLKMGPAEDWPRGFYRADGLTPLWIVVLTELPCTPETRVLRLCGTTEMRRVAVAEIDSLSEDDPSRQPLLSMLLVVRHLLRNQPDIESEEPDLMTQARRDFEKFQQEVYRQGMSQGKADDVLDVLTAKGIPVSDAVRNRIRSCADLDTLHRWLIRAVSATTVDEIFKAA